MKTLLAPVEAQDERSPDPGTRLLRGYLHKTSNSLCGIKGYASLIARQVAGDPDQSAWADKIIREVERMEAIFRTVGDLTRPAADGAPGGGLDAVLTAAVAEAAVTHPYLAVVCDDVPDLPTLLPAADLRLVLRELLANCAEGRRGDDGARRVHISLDTGSTGRRLLRVADDGPGMGPELLARAADPFVTTKAERPGVGLTRVETILEMYGLAWQFHSEPGTGTTVTCELTDGPERIPADPRQGRKAD